MFIQAAPVIHCLSPLEQTGHYIRGGGGVFTMTDYRLEL